MSKKFPWYQRNPSKFIAGTVGLRWEVKTCYSVVLDLIYDGQGSCPDDPKWIANILGVGMSVRRWNLVREELLKIGKIEARAGRLYNATASAVFANLSRTETASPLNIEASKNKDKAVDKIVENGDGLFPANGLVEVSPNPSDTRARTSSEREREKESSTGGEIIVLVSEIASILQQDRGKFWELQARDMIEDGIKPSYIKAAAMGHTGGRINTLKSLAGLAWHKQRKAEKDGHETEARPQTGAEEVSVWAEAMVRLAHSGTWPDAKLGPMPGTMGFQGPKDLETQWLAGWRKQGSHPLQELDANQNFVAYPASNPDHQRRTRWSSIK